jgi:hypothetical protein
MVSDGYSRSKEVVIEDPSVLKLPQEGAFVKAKKNRKKRTTSYVVNRLRNGDYSTSSTTSPLRVMRKV